MRIAFTSCFDAMDDDEQRVWSRIKACKPDVLLLLGDAIYMDYWPKLGEPRGYDDNKFAAEMYRRYKRQWQVKSFCELVCSVSRVGIIWDDHDFAWNGACGKHRTEQCVWNDNDLQWVCTPTTTPQPSVDVVPVNKQRISNALFNQFKSMLGKGGSATPYPNMPTLNTMLKTPTRGIQESFDVNGVRFVMLDGRTYREPLLDPAYPGLLLGTMQQTWLINEAVAHPGLKIICSGTALKRGAESWDRYRDYEWLMQQQLANTIVLSGDIHCNARKVHKYKGYTLPEITASGAALPKLGGDSGNFGLLEVGDSKIEVTLYHKNKRETSFKTDASVILPQ